MSVLARLFSFHFQQDNENPRKIKALFSFPHCSRRAQKVCDEKESEILCHHASERKYQRKMKIRWGERKSCLMCEAKQRVQENLYCAMLLCSLWQISRLQERDKLVRKYIAVKSVMTDWSSFIWGELMTSLSTHSWTVSASYSMKKRRKNSTSSTNRN